VVDGNSTAWLLIGNIPGARVSGFLQALQCEDGCVVNAVSYQKLLPSPRRVMQETLRQFKNHNTLMVRLDAPGENTAVLSGLIGLGQSCPDIGVTTNKSVQYLEHGELKHIDFQFFGFQWLLLQVEGVLKDFSKENGVEIIYMNPPRLIAAMADKWDCQQRLKLAGVRTPRLLGVVRDMEHLRELMCSNNMWRVFLKPRYGSSASGVAALQIHPSGKWLSLSGSIEVCSKSERLYNSLKIRRYTDAALIEYIVNHLCRDQLYAEQWIPKSRLGNKVYDIRAVCLRAVADHYVVRLSNSPLTNMHLGNSKQALSALRLSSWQRQALDCTVAQVSACFPSALYMGIDVLLPRGSSKPVVLEVNAFGDQVNGSLSRSGQVYARQIAAMKCVLQSTRQGHYV